MATNLQFIEQFSIANNTSNVLLDNVFSDKYNVYQILLTGYRQISDTGGQRTTIRFIDSAGNVETGATDYNYASLELNTTTTFGQLKSAGTSLIDQVNRVDTTGSGNANIIVYNPYSSNSYTFCQWQSTTVTDPTVVGYKGIGVLKLDETMRGIQLIQNATFGGDNIKATVFGVK